MVRNRKPAYFSAVLFCVFTISNLAGGGGKLVGRSHVTVGAPLPQHYLPGLNIMMGNIGLTSSTDRSD